MAETKAGSRRTKDKAPSTREEQVVDRRRSLLEAAVRVISKRGLIGVTINSIAVLDDAAGTVGRASSQMELGNQAGIAIGTGLAGALVATMGATAAGLSGVLVVAGAGVVLALLAPTRFAETHPPLTSPER